jgi:hypothetical protein
MLACSAVFPPQHCVSTVLSLLVEVRAFQEPPEHSPQEWKQLTDTLGISLSSRPLSKGQTVCQCIHRTEM